MALAEIHVQACLWSHQAHRFAVLFCEGEASDRREPDVRLSDALFHVVRAGGLPLVTDLARFAVTPTPGWHAEVDHAGAVTVHWPHRQTLLSHALLDLPEGWLAEAVEQRVLVLFVGSGFGLRDHRAPHPTEHVGQIAESGALAAGAVRFTVSESPVLSQVDRHHASASHS